jgi:hypothetical protein
MSAGGGFCRARGCSPTTGPAGPAKWASAETTLSDEDGTLVAYATQMMLFTYSVGPPRGS